MIRRSLIALGALAIVSTVLPPGVQSVRAQGAPPAAQTVPAEVPLRPADAKALLGDWTIVATGPQGAITMLLTLNVQEDKVVGDISSDAMGKNRITSVTKFGDDVVLRYSFDYQGNPVPAVVTLTPAGENLKASFDFADGAFTMPATATRKKS